MGAGNREDSGAFRRESRQVADIAARRASRASRDPWLGLVIEGRYELVHRIARGAMGAVYEAEQRPLGRRVAVKLLDPRSDDEEAHVHEARFFREAAALARMEGPHTVRVVDYGHWRGKAWLALEHVDGRTLRSMQAAGPMDPGQLVRVAMQVCDALREAHGHGLMHRDLKPANILITQQGDREVVKLIDFGLAKETAHALDLTAEGRAMGTPMYMAPEQVRGGRCDHRIDIYALGVVLFRGLTGRAPFPHEDPMEVLRAHLHEDVPTFAKVAPERSLPPVFEWTVRRCLEKDPNKRFASVVELSRALAACQVALDQAPLRDLSLDLADGCTVLPHSLVETLDGRVVPRHVSPRAVDAPPTVRWPLAAAALAAVGLSAVGILGALLLV